jgi:hypothetical protein
MAGCALWYHNARLTRLWLDVKSRNSRAMRRDARSRVLPMKVFVTDDERARIEQRAASAGLSVSAFLRAAGLHEPIRSVLDHEAVIALARVNADQGRLGGLLKLWLSRESGQGVSGTDIRQLLDRIGEAQAKLADIAGRV